MNDKFIKSRLLNIYMNYLYSLREREEFDDKYGDTDELIKMYEEKLTKYKVKIIKKHGKH